MRRITHTGIFALFMAAVALAAALGQLGHITSGHVLLYLSIFLFIVAGLLWLIGGQQDAPKGASPDKNPPLTPIEEQPEQPEPPTKLLKPFSGVNDTIPFDAESGRREAPIARNPEDRIDQPCQEVQLDKEQEQILRLLFEHSWLSPTELQGRLNLPFQFVMYHLEELEKRRFVTGSRNVLPRIGTRYQISQKGREFVIKNSPANVANPLSSFVPFTDPKTGAVHTIPFSTGYGNLWTEYTEDVLHGIIWRWHYKPEIDNTPRNLTPLCPECENPRALHGDVSRHQQGKAYIVSLKCSFHPQTYSIHLDHNPYDRPFESITKQIQQKLLDDSWVDVVNRKRMARGQAPIGGPIRMPAERALLELQERTKQRQLTPTQRDQLITLLKQGPSADIAVEAISDESEVVGFVHDLANVLRAGGWSVLGIGTLKTADMFTGLKIITETPDGDPPSLALQASLNAIRLSASLESMPDLFAAEDDSSFFDDIELPANLKKLLRKHIVLWVGFKPETSN